MENVVSNIIDIYITLLKEKDYSAKKLDSFDSHIDPAIFLQDHKEMFAHVLWMCETAKTEVKRNLENSLRYLGFVQACLWIGGFYTMEEISAQNRQIDLLK